MFFRAIIINYLAHTSGRTNVSAGAVFSPFIDIIQGVMLRS